MVGLGGAVGVWRVAGWLVWGRAGSGVWGCGGLVAPGCVCWGAPVPGACVQMIRGRLRMCLRARI